MLGNRELVSEPHVPFGQLRSFHLLPMIAANDEASGSDEIMAQSVQEAPGIKQKHCAPALPDIQIRSNRPIGLE
jgi:hypothetical protein